MFISCVAYALVSTSMLKEVLITYHYYDDYTYYNTIVDTKKQFSECDYRDYYSPAPPLYYNVAHLASEIVGMDAQRLRWMNVVISLLMMFALFLTLRRSNLTSAQNLEKAIIFSLSPYIFGGFFILINDNLANFLLYISIWMALIASDDKGMKGNILIVGSAIAAGLTILTRQNYIWIYPVLVCIYWVRGRERQDVVLAVISLVITAFPLLYLFYIWKGMVPPSHQYHHQAMWPNIAGITLALSLLAFYGIVLYGQLCLNKLKLGSVYGWKTIIGGKNILHYVVSVIVVTSLIAVEPLHRINLGTDGYFMNVMSKLPSVAGTPLPIWALSIVGGWIITKWILDKNYLPLSIIVFFIISATFMKQNFQKYYDYAILSTIMIDSTVNSRRIGIIGLFGMLFISVAYFLYVANSGG